MKPSYEELEQKLAESQREFRSADATIENLQMQVEKLAAENAGLKAAIEYCINPDNQPEYHDQGMGCGVEDHGYQRDGYSACYYGWESAMERVYSEVIPDAIPETPATDAFLAEVRASAIPEGYVLVPQEMHLSSEAMEGICFHCGDGDHNFGEFTDGTLFVGDVDYGDGKKVHGLHIATADYPEEGCATICEFAAQLRKGVQS
ncbi:hypothetical protein [Enterobacter kobei]